MTARNPTEGEAWRLTAGCPHCGVKPGVWRKRLGGARDEEFAVPTHCLHRGRKPRADLAVT